MAIKAVSLTSGNHKGMRRASVWRGLAAPIATATLIVLLAFSSIAVVRAQSDAGPSDSQIIQFLERTIDWYRQSSTEQQIETDPADVMTVTDNHSVADQVVKLAFDFARAAADLKARPIGTARDQKQAGTPSQYQALLQMAAKIDKQAQDTQAEVDALRQKVASATGKSHQQLQTQLAEVQGELDLDNARKEAMQDMASFVSGTSANGLGATGLRGQVEELAASVPSALTAPPKANQTPAATAQSQAASTLALAAKPQPAGIWGLTAGVLALSRKVRTVDGIIRRTNDLAGASKDIRTPLINHLRDLSQQGDTLANQADTADSATLIQQKTQLDSLTAQFKQASVLVVPLSEQAILIGVYQRNLANWKTAIRDQLTGELKSLLIRIGFLILILSIVIGGAELWRSAIVHYVHDPRRRYQFLLMRKFVMWFVIAVIIGLTFASTLGSVVTFAGLLTAGVAVALQNVILSIVGYFFLIGKFGIRVGDRVQAGGVTGTVIDIGLVRFHVMELAGEGAIPTGRVAAFSNSIVFQSSGALFKQIPGTSFLWHEITLTLPPDTDYAAAKKRLLGALETVLADYHQEMDRQVHAMRKNTVEWSASEEGFCPSAHLRFTASSVEVTLRFPVDLQHSAEIDERVTREVLQALDRDPKIKLAGTGSPEIKLKTDVTAGAAT